MNIGIVGFGNLGKSLYQIIKADTSFNLVAVFSRRCLDLKEYVAVEKIGDFAGKIDVLAIAVGSFADFLPLYPQIAGKFDTVDSFDNHALIEKHKKMLSSNKLSIASVGWDPGILSMVRAICSSLSNAQTVTFWGKGVSQGHSNAARSVEGVDDAVQYTIPSAKILRRAKRGIVENCDSALRHSRLCFVSTAKNKRKEVKKEISSLPNYFAPFRTKIKFATSEKIGKLKKDMSHKGSVYSVNNFGKMAFELEVKNNPLFTASVMLTFAKAIERLKADGFCGAVDCLDIPLAYLVDNKDML